jgi:hypothetical protein
MFDLYLERDAHAVKAFQSYPAKDGDVKHAVSIKDMVGVRGVEFVGGFHLKNILLVPIGAKSTLSILIAQDLSGL